MQKKVEAMKDGYSQAMIRSPDMKKHMKGRQMEAMESMAKIKWDL